MEKHNHKHSHDHSHDISQIKGIRLVFVVILNFLITLAEIIGGILSGSLSLLSDALHNFSDGVAIVISYLAFKISHKGNDEKRTFGYKRSTILAALVNSSFLIIISIYLLREAYDKFLNPHQIKGGIMIWVAVVGLIANLLGVLLLKKASKGDMNIKSSYLHLLSDTLSSVGVIIGGVLIYYFQILWVDPVLTVIISFYVFFESINIIKKAINILMQGTPENLNVEEIAKEIEKIPDVKRVHHVHVWCLDEHNINFEAHININDMPVSETKRLREQIQEVLLNYDINHTTIQFEYNCCDDVDIISKNSCC